MSIAKLKRLNLVADADEREKIIADLQTLGVLHIVPLRQDLAHGQEMMPQESDEALRYLLDSPNKRRLQKPRTKISLTAVVDKVIHNKLARSDVLDQIELIRQHQKALEPWGQFEYPELSELGDYRLWFYTLAPSKFSALKEVELPWEIVSKDHKYLYLVALAKDEPSFEEVPFERAHTGSDSLQTLEEKREAALVLLEDLNAERESLTRWILSLSEAIDAAHDQLEQDAVKAQCIDQTGCFGLSAWIPESELTDFECWSKDHPVAYELSDPRPDDSVPTLLQNNDWYGGGEAAVGFFQMPGYRAWDPSPVVFCSFALFFAMILADAGYALLLGAIVYLISLRADKENVLTRRLINMSWTLVATSVVFGMLVGSYFGVEPHTGVLSNVHILDMQNYGLMMQFSIGIGVLHIALANLVSGWRKAGQLQAIARFGWSTLVLSSYAMWLEYLGTDEFSMSQTYSVYPAGLGLAAIMLFTGNAGFSSPMAIVKQLAEGVKALYDLSKAFGDILSYMRLFALGLSSASLAVTFNSLAISARDALPQGGVIVFILILLLGHGLNLLLGLMSGVIHGLRLNLLEFYNWGIEEEGYAFKAFKKRGD